MSTRCNIIIRDKYGEDIVLYHHHDGYPEGVGEELEMLIRERKITACCDEYGVANKLIKGILVPFNNGTMEDNEFELTRAIHGDIEYLYTIELLDTKVINDKQHENVVMLKCEEHDGNRATGLVYVRYYSQGKELK